MSDFEQAAKAMAANPPIRLSPARQKLQASTDLLLDAARRAALSAHQLDDAKARIGVDPELIFSYAQQFRTAEAEAMKALQNYGSACVEVAKSEGDIDA